MKGVSSQIGEFKAGKRDGEGLYTFPNKDIYSGKWRNGKKHGKGTYRFSDTQMKVVWIYKLALTWISSLEPGTKGE